MILNGGNWVSVGFAIALFILALVFVWAAVRRNDSWTVGTMVCVIVLGFFLFFTGKIVTIRADNHQARTDLEAQGLKPASISTDNHEASLVFGPERCLVHVTLRHYEKWQALKLMDRRYVLIDSPARLKAIVKHC